MVGISLDEDKEIPGIPQLDTQSHRLGGSSFTSVQQCSCKGKCSSVICMYILYTAVLTVLSLFTVVI